MGVSLRENGPASSPQYQAPHRHNGGSEHAPEFATSIKVGAFRLGGVLSEGMSFPYDFGFIPSTLGDDGDPLNVLILLDAPVLMGCLVTVRLLGVIETEQQERDGERNRNDRLIAAATHAHTHEPIRSLEDLPSYLLTEVEGFFAQYNQLRGKHFDPIGRGDMERALILIEDGRKAFEASSAQ